jgi:hypothetical protein
MDQERARTSPQTARGSVGSRAAILIGVAVLAHLGLLLAGYGLVGDPSLAALVLAGAAIALGLPLGLRLMTGSGRPWWLVMPAMALLLWKTLGGTVPEPESASVLATSAATAWGASLALSTSAAILGVRAGLGLRPLALGRTLAPLVVGWGGVAFVLLVSLEREAPLVFALPAALVATTTIAAAAGLRRQGPATGTAILIACISLGAVALASLAAGAVAWSYQIADAPTLAPATSRRVMQLAWLGSVPVVGALVAGFGLRLPELGLAWRATRLEALVMTGLLLVSVTLGGWQMRSAFNRAESPPSAAPGLASLAPSAEPGGAGSAPVSPERADRPSAPAASAKASTPTKATSVAAEMVDIERASVRIGRPTIRGQLLEKEVLDRLERTVDHWQKCYESLPPPRPSAQATLQFHIDEIGSVAKAELHDSTAPDKLTRCLLIHLYRSGFANTRQEAATVRVPIRFEPSE